MVAEQLLEKADWKSLASLDRLIHQLDAKLSAAEAQNMMQGEVNGIASSLNVKDLDGFSIKIR